MKKIFEYADKYIKQMTASDFTLLKICLFSMGLAAGLFVSEKHKKTVFFSSIVAFIVTYIPLMADFFNAVKQN